MYDMAKKARSAMKAKASRLSSADPHQKVDSSTWTPPEALNTEAKTGLRPISRRAFKSGGSVKGEKAACNMGRKPRKSGGEASKYAIAKINRNVKEANEERPGKKHVGGMKKGGRAHKSEGGDAIGEFLKNNPAPNPAPQKPPASTAPSKPAPAQKPPSEDITDPKNWPSHINSPRRKYGGRSHKNSGGALPNFDIDPVIPGMKKGGKAHTDEKMDIALIKKMVKPGARKGKNIGGMLGGLIPMAMGAMGKKDEKKSGGRTARKGRASGGDAWDQVKLEPSGTGKGLISDPMPGTPFDTMDKAKSENQRRQSGSPVRLKKGGMAHADEKMDIALIKKMVKPGARKARATGGEVFSGPSYPGKIPGVTGGRIARATGGKTKGKGKGKTNINIIIAAGKPAGGAEMMGPPPGMDAGPQGMPVPVPPPQGGAPGAAPMPMPVPMPMPMPAAPAGGPPMPRKNGGRLTAKASSYKDMTAGSGSGEGRLQKTDIAKARMGRKAGGKAYRSYKDMDAGAGSGLGRLEKTEIQARKR